MGSTCLCCPGVRLSTSLVVLSSFLISLSLYPFLPISHALTQPAIADSRTLPITTNGFPSRPLSCPFSPSPPTRDAPAFPRSAQFCAILTRKRERGLTFWLPSARTRHNDAHDRGRDTRGETCRARRAKRASHPASDKHTNTRVQISLQRILFPYGYRFCDPRTGDKERPFPGMRST
jgi:hypothetical protein